MPILNIEFILGLEIFSLEAGFLNSNLFKQKNDRLMYILGTFKLLLTDVKFLFFF